MITDRIGLALFGGVSFIAAVWLAFAWMGEAASHKVEKSRADATHKVMIQKATELGQCQSQLRQARGEIDGQNDQIKQWRGEAEAAEKRADERADLARKQGASLRALSARLADASTNSPDRCKAAAELYLETIPELNKWN